MDIKHDFQNLKDAFIHKEKVAEEPTKPLEEEQPEIEPDMKEEQTEDRSAYNCPTCGGEGLVKDGNQERILMCPQCTGTGKVN